MVSPDLVRGQEETCGESQRERSPCEAGREAEAREEELGQVTGSLRSLGEELSCGGWRATGTTD